MSSAPAAGMVVAIDLVRQLGGLKLLDGVSLTVPAGGVQAVIGPSGAGKSTLLRCIGQREAIDGGEIWIDGELISTGRLGGEERTEPGGEEVAHQRGLAGLVCERPELLGHMTLLQNLIEGPLALSRRPRREIVAEGMALLERVGLAERRDAYPAELSGGEQRRATIARAWAPRPKLMLFDEPAAALAPDEAVAVMSVVRNLAAAGATMIVVTHDPGFIRQVASHVAVMGAGRIVARGAPGEILASPQAGTRDLVASLLG